MNRKKYVISPRNNIIDKIRLNEVNTSIFIESGNKIKRIGRTGYNEKPE